MARLWHGVKRGPRSSRSGIEGRARSGDSRLLSELLPSPGATAVRWADPVGGRCSRAVDATSSGSGAYARIWGTATAGTVPCTDRGVRSGRLGRLQAAGLQGRLQGALTTGTKRGAGIAGNPDRERECPRPAPGRLEAATYRRTDWPGIVDREGCVRWLQPPWAAHPSSLRPSAGGI